MVSQSPIHSGQRKKRIFTIIAVITITMLALGLRGYAANTLNIDYDEPVYLHEALEYTYFMRHGEYTWLAWYQGNYEHPSFYKILYGLVLFTQPQLDKSNPMELQTPMQAAQDADYGMTGRWVSVIFGTIAVAVTAAISPAAGIFAAVYSLGVKYTSQFYLEALPLLTSLLAVAAYLEFYKVVRVKPVRSKRAMLWLGASAVLLGITAASKYLYAIVGPVILIHALLQVVRKEIPVKVLLWLGGWGVLSLMSFFVFDPYLWPHPVERFVDSMEYHLKYPSTDIVKLSGYPWWQPLRWLYNPFAYYDPQPASAFPVQSDPLIAALAVI